MDVPCEVQGNIHVCLALFNMCPVFWVHIIAAEQAILRFKAVKLYV